MTLIGCLLFFTPPYIGGVFFCHPSVFPPSNACFPPSIGLRSFNIGCASFPHCIRVFSLRPTLAALRPTLAALRPTFAPLHQKGFPPFPLLSEWLPLLQKGFSPFLGPSKGCAPFPLLSEWLPSFAIGSAPFLGHSNWLRSIKRASLLCHWLLSVLRAIQGLRSVSFVIRVASAPLPLAPLRS